ncbi:MAG: hypothetical protein PHP06_04030 [Clostridia bacterium]|nr:hypothetical protein [Clostridia bacterium]
MKRLILIVLSLYILAFTAGCGDGSPSPTAHQDKTDDHENIEHQGHDNQQKDVQNIEEQQKDDNSIVLKPKDKNLTGEKNTKIIVKSDTIISNQEKEKLLNELEDELDNLLDSINQMDDVKDSDLSF